MGVVESVAHKFQVATGTVSAPDTHAAIHLEKIKLGMGSMFESPEAKAVAQAYYDQIRQTDADAAADRQGKERKKVEPRLLQTLDTLPEDVRSELAKRWVAGHYAEVKPSNTGDVLSMVDMYSKLNGTYLPHAKKSFEEKLKTLLPASYLEQHAGATSERKASQKPL